LRVYWLVLLLYSIVEARGLFYLALRATTPALRATPPREGNVAFCPLFTPYWELLIFSPPFPSTGGVARSAGVVPPGMAPTLYAIPPQKVNGGLGPLFTLYGNY